MNISVTSTIIEFDNRADSYGRCDLGTISKPDEKFSYFSNLDELNALPKNISGVPKVGDQRSIVDFLGFYNEDEDAEF